ncbi:MAG: Enamidase [Deltaproteobacteria bacterium HGW-Deltaproteobacteria-21]|nr:MAG: Enamidase [Deltaproteobacteria bacterium HGW-Deltaproteobacteria-21]
MSNLLLKNIGTLVSGDIANPLLKADAIWIEEGVIRKVGLLKDMDERAAEKVIDCAGTTVTPGLIDSHVHPVLGDFTPRQKQQDFLESEVHGGVTTAISAGEVHLPGRPKDPSGTKALAILAAKSFAAFRPGGMKVLGGSVILENGLVEKDFEEMAKEGVRVVGEIGLGSVKSPEDAAPMVKWARKNGMVVMMHTGGTSIPGSTTVGLEQVLGADPDIVSHINGGPTACSIEEAEKLIAKTSMAVEFVHCGNMKTAVEIGSLLVKHNALHRAIIGNDAPSGTGVVPLGVLRVLSLLAGMTTIKPEEALCMATGNTAKLYKLNRGIVEPGREADIVVMDTPMGSVGKNALAALAAGDVPAVSMVLVDGKVVVNISRNTPPPVKKPTVTKG